MKKVRLAHKLAGLTFNLTSPSPENETSLDSIRRVLGYNLRSDRQDISVVNPLSIELEAPLSNEKIQEFTKYAVSRLPKEDRFLVQRIEGKDVVPVVGMQIGDIRLPINPINVSDEVRWNQKRGEQIGPFLSHDGYSVWFDLYYYEEKLTVRSEDGSKPHFLFSKAKRNIWLNAFKNTQTVRLQEGHVWILGKLFTKDAGDNEYVGFNIKNGSFTLSNTKQWSGGNLDFEGNFTGKLTVQLVQPERNTPAFEGCDAAQSIDFQYPDEITLEWRNGKLITISSDDNGEFKGYGNELTFSNFKATSVYESGLNHVFIPCQTEPTAWKVDSSQSRILDANGNAEIKKSFWALPVVRVSNPTTLGEPGSNGGWGLRLSSDVTARWIGSDEQQPNAKLNDTLLLLYPHSLFLYSQKTTVNISSTSEIRQDFLCWQPSTENSARVPLALRYQNDFPFIYYCHATEGETLLAGCAAQIQPDRPVFADGSRCSMKDLKGWVTFHVTGTEVKINALFGSQESQKQPAKPLALQNALMNISQPNGLVLDGVLAAQDTNSIEKGQITLTHGLLRWKPILPDPYVSNLKAGWETRQRVGSFSSTLYSQISWNQPDKPTIVFKGELPLSAGIGAKTPGGPAIQSLSVQLDERSTQLIKQNEINGRQQEEKNKIDNVFNNMEERLSGWKLLDVSTNMDLIGVSVSPSLFAIRGANLAVTKSTQSISSAFIVKNLAVNTPLSLVHVFTVPQVQWEPVRTLPEDQNIAALGWFPEYLGSATDGGPTRLFGIGQELSPIIPDIVVRQIRESFRQGNPAAALTTLSFGLKAVVRLSPKNSPDRNADSLDIVQPEFPKKRMKGGIQINMMAEAGNPQYARRSPGFEGLMAQTLNGYELFTGTELGLSVLGATLQPDASVETQFNKEFAPGGSNPFVPVTRFDLSGYGASNFSEWDNPEAMASIGKVQFKIMVGRTAFEVVKFVSKIYPWGPTVTRTVTIERRSGGGVIRKDTGWQATQAAIFDFRVTGVPNNPYVFRPGIFRGCFDIKNIRPASNDILKFVDPDNGNNVELAPVYFDAYAQFDGQVGGNIYSKGILGFIQLEPKPKKTGGTWLPRLLSTGALRKLIIDQGAIGGPIDTTLNVGNSGLMFRASRFEVDVTDNAGKPNFIGVVRGQPALPNNGSWSVVKLAAPGNTADPQEATTADVSRGTPLFIENTWLPPSGNAMNVSGSSGPYRFADPVDLFASQPRYDYGLMQNTGSQAFLFRRPKIEPGSNEISSVVKPAFADLFAMTTSKGVFPPIPNAIEFPSANYKLLIKPGSDKLRLNTPISLTNMRPPLLVEKEGTGQMMVAYDQSQLKFNLNFDDWNVEFDNLFFWTSMAGISNLFGNRFDLKAGTAQRSRLVNVKSLLKKEIRDTLSFIPGMAQDQDVHDIDLGMTNSKKETTFFWGIECGIEIELKTGKVEAKCKSLSGAGEEDEEEEKHSSIELSFKGAAGKGEYPGSKSEFEHQFKIPSDGRPQWLSFASAGIEFQAKLPIGGIFFIVLGVGVEVHFLFKPKKEESLELKAYAGIGVGGNIGPFSAEAFIAGGVIVKFEDKISVLWLAILEAEIDLFIVVVKVEAELQGYVVKDGEADIGIASGEVAIHVSIFLVFNITASYEHEEEENLKHY